MLPLQQGSFSSRVHLCMLQSLKALGTGTSRRITHASYRVVLSVKMMKSEQIQSRNSAQEGGNMSPSLHGRDQC